jgi:hypothetical protein
MYVIASFVLIIYRLYEQMIGIRLLLKMKSQIKYLQHSYH